jgi:hypothetical protein
MSHAPQGGQAPDQASSGRQTGAAVPLGQIIPKARNAASHLTSHKQHGDTNLATAPDRPTRRVSQSPERGYCGAASIWARSGSRTREAAARSSSAEMVNRPTGRGCSGHVIRTT